MSQDPRIEKLYATLPFEVWQVIRDVKRWDELIHSNRIGEAAAILGGLPDLVTSLKAWEKRMLNGCQVPPVKRRLRIVREPAP